MTDNETSLQALLARIPDPTPAAIAALRRDHGLSQQQLAALVHAGLRTANRWESGQQPIPRAEWELLWLKLHPDHPAITTRRR